MIGLRRKWYVYESGSRPLVLECVRSLHITHVRDACMGLIICVIMCYLKLYVLLINYINAIGKLLIMDNNVYQTLTWSLIWRLHKPLGVASMTWSIADPDDLVKYQDALNLAKIFLISRVLTRNSMLLAMKYSYILISIAVGGCPSRTNP